MNRPIEIFCCAAEPDQPFLEKLDTRLTVQEQRGTIKLWDKSQIPAGANADKEIRQHLASAHIFLLLIGPDFLKDDYCYNTVMKVALEKDTRGEAITIPVIVRHADWKNIPVLKDKQVLPRGGQPIIGQADEDKALFDVAEEIGKIIKGLGQPQVESDSGPESRQYRGTFSSTEDSPKAPYAGRSSSVEEPPKASPVPPRSQQRTSVSAGTILKLILTRRWGWTGIGLLVLVIGVLWGYSSPTVAYIGPPRGPSTQLIAAETNNGDIYIYPSDKSEFFIARHDDFSPPIDPAQIHLGMRVDLRARPDTISVNDTIDNKPVTQAYVIEQLNLYDQNSNPLSSYKARDYNASGFYESRWWPVAYACIAVGVLITCVAFFVGRKRRKGASQ